MPDYLINGSTASFLPVKQTWSDIVLGRNLLGETIYSNHKDAVLEFDTCEMSLFKQWEDVTTGGSLYTITILSPDQITYTAYSGVIMEFERRPSIQWGAAIGPWSLRLRDILA